MTGGGRTERLDSTTTVCSFHRTKSRVVPTCDEEWLERRGLAAGGFHKRRWDDSVTRTQGAGLRQRREGLTDRLTWRRGGVLVSKRVPPGVQGMTALQQWIDRRAASDPCMAPAGLRRRSRLLASLVRPARLIDRGLEYADRRAG